MIRFFHVFIVSRWLKYERSEKQVSHTRGPRGEVHVYRACALGGASFVFCCQDLISLNIILLNSIDDLHTIYSTSTNTAAMLVEVE